MKRGAQKKLKKLYHVAKKVCVWHLCLGTVYKIVFFPKFNIKDFLCWITCV